MKNFQQSPKQRRVAMARTKGLMAHSRPKAFQPKEAWSSKRTLGGVPASVLNDKQVAAGHPGVGNGGYFGWW